MWKGMSTGVIHAPVTEGRGTSGHKILGTFRVHELGVKSSRPNHICNGNQTQMIGKL